MKSGRMGSVESRRGAGVCPGIAGIGCLTCDSRCVFTRYGNAKSLDHPPKACQALRTNESPGTQAGDLSENLVPNSVELYCQALVHALANQAETPWIQNDDSFPAGQNEALLSPLRQKPADGEQRSAGHLRQFFARK